MGRRHCQHYRHHHLLHIHLTISTSSTPIAQVPISERVMYDDFNELFWDVERVKKLLPLSGTPDTSLELTSYCSPLMTHHSSFRHARAARDRRVPPLSRAVVRGGEARGRRDGRAPRALLQDVPREGRLVPRVRQLT